MKGHNRSSTMCGEAMFVLLLAAVATAAAVSQGPSNLCELCLNGKCYISTSIPDHLQRIHINEPVQAAIKYTTSSLYFGSGPGFKVLYLPSLRDDSSKYIHAESGDKNKPIIAVDQVDGGLHVVYNPIDPSVDELARSIHKWWVFNGTIYYTKYADKNKIENGLFWHERIIALDKTRVKDIVFDTSGTLYIQAEEQLYKLKTSDGTNKQTLIGGPIHPEKILLSGSINGTVYVLDTSNKLIYTVDPATDQLQNVGYLRDRLATIEIKKWMIDPLQNVMFVVRDNEKCVFEYYLKTDYNCEDAVSCEKTTLQPLI